MRATQLARLDRRPVARRARSYTFTARATQTWRR